MAGCRDSVSISFSSESIKSVSCRFSVMEKQVISRGKDTE